MKRRYSLVLFLVLTCGCGQSRVAQFVMLGLGDACTPASFCRPPLTCDANTGTCAPTHSRGVGESCVLSGDCLSTLYCANGLCQTAGTLPAGAACKSTSECLGGLFCAFAGMGGTCTAGGTIDLRRSCVATTECAAGLFCDPVELTCISAWDAPYGASCTLATEFVDCDPDHGWLCDPATQTCAGRGPDGQPVPNWAGIDSPDPTVMQEGKFFVYFRVPGPADQDFFRLPYPNDIRIKNTRVDLTGFPLPPQSAVPSDFVSRLTQAIAANQDGFGPNETVFFRFSGPPKFCTKDCAPCDAGCMGKGEPARTVYVVDLDTSQLNGKTHSWFASTGQQRFIGAPYLAVWLDSLSTWDVGHTYAVFVHARVQGRDNDIMQQDPDFLAMLNSTLPTDTRLQGAWAKYQKLRDWLATNPKDNDGLTPITAADLAAAAVFTIRDPQKTLKALGARVEALVVPPAAHDLVACTTTTAAPECSDPADHAFLEVQGQIDLPIFQAGTAPFQNTGGGIVVNAGSVAEVQRTEAVRFVLTIPTAALGVANVPVVLYAHGIDEEWRGHITNGLADALAAVNVTAGASPGTAQFAVLGFEQVEHGNRRDGSVLPPAMLFFNLLNVEALKGNALQAAADQMAVIKGLGQISTALATAANGPVSLASTTLDLTRVAMVGLTQGAQAGALAMARAGAALGPALQSGVLASLGGLRIQGVLSETKPLDYSWMVPLLLAETHLSNPRVVPVLSMLQGYLEDADPTNFAGNITVSPLTGSIAKSLVHVVGASDPYTAAASALTLGYRAQSQLFGGAIAFLNDVGTGVAPPVTAVSSLVQGNQATSTKTVACTIHAPATGQDGHQVLLDSTTLTPTSAFTRVRQFLGSWLLDTTHPPTVPF